MIVGLLIIDLPDIDGFVLLAGRRRVISPQGLSVFGKGIFGPFQLTMNNAGLLCIAGSIQLLTNGARKVICWPLLHAGDVTAVQSPASIACVGMKARRSSGSWRRVVPW